MGNVVRALPLFAVIALLAVLTFVVGRALAHVLRIGLLRGRHVESLLGCCFLGTAALILLFGYGSHAGLAAPWASAIALAVTGAVVALALRREGFAAVALPRVHAPAALAVTLCVAGRVVVYMLPVCLGNCVSPFNDSTNYVVLAEWLQHEGFGSPCSGDPAQPYTPVIESLQEMRHRTGPIFLHAFLLATTPRFTGYELFAVATAWGAALNVAGIYLLCRWAVGMPVFYSCVAALVAAFGCNTLDFSCTYGHFSNVYGTATAAFLLAFLARTAYPCRQSVGNGLLLGASAAMMVSSYPEMVPLLAPPAVIYAVAVALRAWRRRLGRGVLFLAGCLLVAVLLANVEIGRAYHFLVRQVNLKVAGGHVPWTAAEFAAYIVGNLPVRPYISFHFMDRVPTALLLIVLLTAAAGLCSVLLRRRALFLSILLGMALLFWYQATQVPDPWTGARGQTFHLFKLAKWSFPLMAVVFGAGLMALSRLFRYPRATVLLAALGVCGYSMFAHVAYARQYVAGVQAVSGSRKLFTDQRKLRRQLAALKATSVYYIHEQEGVWPRCYFPCVFYPLPFYNAWVKSQFFSAPQQQQDQFHLCTPGTVFLTHGPPPYSPPKKRLAFNLCLVDGARPLLFRVNVQDGVHAWGEHKGAWLGTEPARLHLFSPRAGEVTLSFDAVPGPSLPQTSRRTLRVTYPDKTFTDHTFDLSGPTRVCVPLKLPAGVSYVDVQCLDTPSLQDPRPLLLGIQDADVLFPTAAPDAVSRAP